MKPAPFDYNAPSGVDEALAILSERGDEAKVLAGGQSLVPLLNLRLARPGLLVDINRLNDLNVLQAVDGGIEIGALTRQRAIEGSSAVRELYPLLAAATTYIGHPAIRTRGTVGGSLAHADPVSELPCVALALDAELLVRDRTGGRTIPAANFFQTVMTTALRPDELLVGVRLPAPAERTGWGFEELARRHGDFAIIAVAALVTLDSHGTIAGARLAYAGAADRPIRARQAEAALVGQRPSASVFEEAARAAVQELDPPSDLHASADYRRKVAVTLTQRALNAASDRAAAS
jgi:CO/xanthine dehydrogenase FAD-binding subunit